MEYGTCTIYTVDSHKYWYDILMGFKNELLLAYIATLLFILVLLIIQSVNRENANRFVIDKMEIEAEGLKSDGDKVAD